MTEIGLMRGYVVMLGAVYLLVMTFAWASPTEIGSGLSSGTTFPNLDTFERVQVSGSADVEIVQSDKQSVVVPGYKAQVDLESVDGTLYIEVDELMGLRPKVHVTMSATQELVVVGSADVKLSGFSGDTIVIEGENSGHGIGHIQANRIRFDHLLVTGSGKFDFDLHGRATHQDISIAGNGRYSAEGLMSQTSVVEVVGQGRINLWTEQFIDLDATDAAQVTYRGTPWINQQTSGSAHIQARYPKKKAPIAYPQVYPRAQSYTTSL